MFVLKIQRKLNILIRLNIAVKPIALGILNNIGPSNCSHKIFLFYSPYLYRFFYFSLTHTLTLFLFFLF